MASTYSTCFVTSSNPTRDYRRLPARTLAGGAPTLASTVLSLELRLTERGLRFHDARTGHDLPTLAEEAQARQEAEARLARETAARKAAEARVAELEARLRQTGGSDPAGG